MSVLLLINILKIGCRNEEDSHSIASTCPHMIVYQNRDHSVYQTFLVNTNLAPTINAGQTIFVLIIITETNQQYSNATLSIDTFMGAFMGVRAVQLEPS